MSDRLGAESAVYAYGLNYLGIVVAIEPSPDMKAVVKTLVKESGHRTFRVIFTDILDESDRQKLLEKLGDLEATYEGASPIYYAIDLKPSGDYQKVEDILSKWEEQGILNYETCESRLVDSFDDAPEE